MYLCMFFIIIRQSAAFSKVSVNSQTVIPREVCEQLKL